MSIETEIAKVKGFTILYDTHDKLFHLKNSNGDEVGSGTTQDDVEKQADTLAKQPYHFPIPALLLELGHLKEGNVTSINLEDRSIRFVYTPKDQYHSHTKQRLTSSHLYELTEHNKLISTELESKRTKIAEIETEINALTDQLDYPIGLAYFNLSRYPY